MNDAGTRQLLPVLGDEEVAGARPAGDEPGAGALVTERGNLPLEALGGGATSRWRRSASTPASPACWPRWC